MMAIKSDDDKTTNVYSNPEQTIRDYFERVREEIRAFYGSNNSASSKEIEETRECLLDKVRSAESETLANYERIERELRESASHEWPNKLASKRERDESLESKLFGNKSLVFIGGLDNDANSNVEQPQTKDGERSKHADTKSSLGHLFVLDFYVNETQRSFIKYTVFFIYRSTA